MTTLNTKSLRSAVLAMAFVAASGATAMAQEPLALQAGILVQVAPKYEGSKSYEVMAFPIVAPAGKASLDDRVQFRGIDHLQFALISTSGFQFGPLVGYRFGRDQDDGRLLNGLGDIDGGFVAGAFASYQFGAIRASVSYHHQLTGDDTGGIIKAGFDTRHAVSPYLTLTGGIGVTWASDDYMQSFFGVTAAQSITSGLAAYQADAGVKDFNLSIGSEMVLSPQWMLSVNGRYARLLGDADNSPVVESRDQWTAGIALTYQFSTAP